LRQKLPTLSWVKEAMVLPAAEKRSDELTPEDMTALAQRTGADTLITGGYVRLGDKIVLHGRVLDLARAKTWASLAPIDGAAADPLPAVDELAERLLGISWYLAVARQERISTSHVLNLSVPMRLDALQILWAAGGARNLTPGQRDAEYRRAYERDPKGGVRALVEIFVDRIARGEYAEAEAVLVELNALPPERFTPDSREKVAWGQAILQGNSAAMTRAAGQLHRWSPDNYFWQRQWLSGLAGKLDSAALLAAFADVTEGSEQEKNPMVWSTRTLAHVIRRDYGALVGAAERLIAVQPETLQGVRYLIMARIGRKEFAEAERLLRELEGRKALGRFSYPGLNYLIALAQLRQTEGMDSPHFRSIAARAEAWFASRSEKEAALPERRYDWARLLYLAGRYADARAVADELGRNFPEEPVYRALQAACALRLKDPRGAEASQEWLRGMDSQYQFGLPEYLRARLAAVEGKREDALRLLREAVAKYAVPLKQFSLEADFFWDPDFEALAGDPEYESIMGRSR
jgi:hypothetical protein